MDLKPVHLKNPASLAAAIIVVCKGCGTRKRFGEAVNIGWVYDSAQASTRVYFCAADCVDRPVGRIKRTRH